MSVSAVLRDISDICTTYNVISILACVDDGGFVYISGPRLGAGLSVVTLV